MDDRCVDGNCVGTAYSCDDENSCTTDTCNGDGTCSTSNHSGTCDDGNSCTQNDVCSGGVCIGTSCGCEGAPCCASDSCNGDLACVSGTCQAPCTNPKPRPEGVFDAKPCSFRGITASGDTLAFFADSTNVWGLCRTDYVEAGAISVSGATFTGTIKNDCRIRRIEGHGNELKVYGGVKDAEGDCGGLELLGTIQVAGAQITGTAQGYCAFQNVKSLAKRIEFTGSLPEPTTGECIGTYGGTGSELLADRAIGGMRKRVALRVGTRHLHPSDRLG